MFLSADDLDDEEWRCSRSFSLLFDDDDDDEDRFLSLWWWWCLSLSLEEEEEDEERLFSLSLSLSFDDEDVRLRSFSFFSLSFSAEEEERRSGGRAAAAVPDAVPDPCRFNSLFFCRISRLRCEERLTLSPSPRFVPDGFRCSAAVPLPPAGAIAGAVPEAAAGPPAAPERRRCNAGDAALTPVAGEAVVLFAPAVLPAVLGVMGLLWLPPVLGVSRLPSMDGVTDFTGAGGCCCCALAGFVVGEAYMLLAFWPS